MRGSTPLLFAVLLPVFLLAAVRPAAADDKIGDIIARLGDYIVHYEERLATVVAEETYTQTLQAPTSPAAISGGLRGSNQYGPADRRLPVGRGGAARQVRTLLSDYALMRPDDGDRWVGLRDTFEVDGKPVRDREQRLQRLIGTGAYAQAARIAELNSRFNLGSDVVTRNINVPTFVLELLHPRNRDRFSYQRKGTETVAGRTGVLIEFRERRRPTIVRMPDGRDQATRGTVLVDPITGEVLRTTVTWEKVSGSISVTFGTVPGIPVPVPLTMTETYTRAGTVLSGEATYANYRTFQTGGRLIAP
jgi:hypothetical protein